MTPSEKEMLEMAAKAMGWLVDSFGNDGFAWIYDTTSQKDASGEYRVYLWGPTLDPGDCARMKTALRLDDSWIKDCVAVCHDKGSPAFIARFTDHNNDSLAAWMHACTAVAAEIGRQTK